MGTGCAPTFGSELIDLGSVIARSSGEDDASRRKHSADTRRADRNRSFISVPFLVRNCAPILNETVPRLAIVRLLLQACLCQHFQKLFLRAHVDRLRHDLPITVVNECLRNALNLKQLIDLASGMEQHRISYSLLLNKRLCLVSVFV